MKTKFFSLLIAISLGTSASFSQSLDTVKVGIDERINLLQSGVVLAVSEVLAPEVIWQKILTQPHKADLQKVNIGFTRDIYWIGFIAQNHTGHEMRMILEIDNPQIDRVAVYEINEDGVPLVISETGDKVAFDHRMIINRNYAFPLEFNPGEVKNILIKADKRNSSLSIPIFLWKDSAFHEKVYHENLGFGLFFGFLTLCLLYAILAFVFVRKTVYGWYALWIAGTGLYVSTALGLSFQYIYPTLSDFNSYFRVYLEVIIFFAIVKFSQAFLNFSVLASKVHRILNYILLLFIILITWSAIDFDFFANNSVWITPIVNGILIAGGLLIMVGAVQTFRKQPVNVYFYFTALGFLLASYMATNLAEFGIDIFKNTFNLVLVGSSMEIFVFSIALTYQIKKLYEERNQLSLDLARKQKDLLKAYVEGVEKERERISRELHDDLGSRLGNLKRFVSDKNDKVYLENQIDVLCENVRTMSHQLSPASMRMAGLHQQLNTLAFEAYKTSNTKVEIQFYDVPEKLSDEISHHLYRVIQEAINNSIKHGSSSEIDIQLFCHGGELVATIDDNGKGYNTHNRGLGIGLKNMKARVESLNGTLEVSSREGEGTSILIQGIKI